jgi:predicted phosphodiesterase
MKDRRTGIPAEGIGDFPRRIGLMADSHGDVERTRSCIALFRRLKADGLFHLGDACDFLKPATILPMIRLLEESGVRPVKGNNELQAERGMAGRFAGPAAAGRRALEYFRGMPYVREFDGLCFAHSMPWGGIRSVYEPVDDGGTEKAAFVFRNTAYRIVFCGHSHVPVLFRWRSGEIRRERVEAGAGLRLEHGERYIIVVGALERGGCGLFDRESMTYETLEVDSPAAGEEQDD